MECVNQPATDYNDCLNMGNVVCDTEGSTCLLDNVMAPTVGSCALRDCVDDCDCPEAPPTGTAPAICDDVLGPGMNACVLDCSDGQTCPTGMDCFGGQICLWPDLICGVLPVGNYDDCGSDPFACVPGASCVSDDPMAPTFSVCATLDCVTDCDCPAGPATGTAQPRCDGILVGGQTACYLDCNAGQTCPTGMSCNQGICAW